MSFRSPERITNKCMNCGHSYRVMPLGSPMYCSKDCQTCASFTFSFVDVKDPRTIKENKQAVYEFAQAIHALEEKESAPTTLNTARDRSISPYPSGNSSPSSPCSPRVTDSPPVSPYPKKETTSPRKSLFRSLLGRA